MNPLLLYYLWKKNHEDEDEDDGINCGLLSGLCEWTKFDEWLDKHKLLQALYPWVVSLLLFIGFILMCGVIKFILYK